MIGDWSDSRVVGNTDRTVSTIQLVEKIEKLEKENKQLRQLLKECKHIMSIEKDFASCHFEKDKLCKLLTKINQVLGED